MANIDKNNLLHDCKTFGNSKDMNAPRCKNCIAKFKAQADSCIAAMASAKSAKVKASKTEKTPVRIPGYWGYAVGSFTDIFCNAICERPMTMNQAAAIIDSKTGEPIGPHPKCKKRLIAEGLAACDGHFVYMRVWPKGHAEAGKLTPAAKIARSKVETKAETKAA